MLYVESDNEMYTSLGMLFPKTFHMLNGLYSTCLPFHKLLSDPWRLFSLLIFLNHHCICENAIYPKLIRDFTALEWPSLKERQKEVFTSLPLSRIAAAFIRHRMPTRTGSNLALCHKSEHFCVLFFELPTDESKHMLQFKLWGFLFLVCLFVFFFPVQQLFNESHYVPWNYIFINTFLTISNLSGTHLAMAGDSLQTGICGNKNNCTYNKRD